jgi:Kef-type K+ transport system membrane component KefB
LTQSELYLLVLLGVFALPFLVWRGLGRPIWLPLVVVQILAGILLGPGVLGALAPDLHARIFTPGVTTLISGVALWAVVLFVFLAGLELDLEAAWADRAETLTVAGLALAVPLALGTAAGAALLLTPGWIGPAASPWQAALGFGMACAVTALPILILFLKDLGIFREPLGQRVLRYASLDDIAIWAVLALILLDWDRVGRQVLFLGLFALAAWGMRRLIPRLGPADRWPTVLIWLIAAALASDWAGLHYIVGAFLAGAVLEARWFGPDRIDSLHAAVLLLLMPVFFLSTGLRTGWDMGGPAVIAAALLLLVAAVGGKLAGVALAGRLAGWPRSEAWTIGWLLQTKALIMIIFANVLLDRSVISPAAFTALLLMALISTMLTMPVVSRSLGRSRA